MRRTSRPTRSFSVLLLLAAIFGAVALLLVLIAGGLVLQTRSFLADAVSATGTVVALVERESCSTEEDEDGRSRRTCTTLYAPRILFTTADGRDIEYVSATASSPASYHPGEQVELRYRPEDPHDVRISSYVELWLAPTIVGGIGGIFAVVAGILLGVGRAASTLSQPDPAAGPEPFVEPEPDESSGWQ
ncbi:MAG TPA: DUF3592 domain-containing protein, partial [Microlunatus sp.]|nr:DUF3592 domain-containing protein [Microlunatus sp.]